ncbi:hypothetical protein NEMIN01_1415 [Nematocida minor]|uniref:uncharacterized protein n=1 Tax=Nematocida minor TaxID=1912983 RepID=UPI00221EAB99|nr:uncharacterized protein NEMIN01_1415 [Nematocida minor]KAI5191207.1 hypothetical protein NEMIN01_1415 [Nematocida minor]
MERELRECLQKKTAGVFGGYSKEAYVQEVVCYLIERYQKKKYNERPAKQPEVKKTRLSSFENYTETTSLNRCTVCIVVPNAGLVAEIVARLLENKSLHLNELRKGQYAMTGDDNDDFILPLNYTEEEGFNETSNYQADIVIATTKALVTLGDKRIDRKKYFIEEKDQLADFKQKVKQEMNMYAFLSGVDTAILMDADILHIQNPLSLLETIRILEESKPAPKQNLNLRYLSSGPEKKAFIFLANIITPELVSISRKYEHAKVLSKKVTKSTKIKDSMHFRMNKSTEVNKYTEHHINNLTNKCERVLVVLKDSVELKKIEAEITDNSPMSIQGIFFMDEYTPTSKIKDALENRKRRVWIITERFIFYRRKRLSRIVTPFNPVKVFSPHIVNPRLLKLLADTVSPQETEDSIYSSPIILTATSTAEEYFLSELFGKQVSISELFAYCDDIKMNKTEEE